MTQHLKRPFILASVMLGMFLSAIEATIVATAMPSIVADLNHFSLYSWVFSAYLLTSSATVLIFGKLADIYGRKPIYVLGITVFLVGSVFAAISTSMVMLITARIIQGIGAGAIAPIATTIVGDIYNRTERAKIQGYLSSVWGISAILGPLIGAFFVDFLNWRYVFWINIPLGILSMIGIVFYLKENIQKEKRKVDLLGTVLIMVGISLLMYILVEGGLSIPWASFTMYSMILTILLCFILFLFHEKRAIDPMMPATIWRYRLIKFANIASLLTGIIMISVSSYLPTFVQGVMGQSALIAGFTLTAMSIGWPIASTVAGRLLLSIGYRKTAWIGGISLLIGTGLFVLLPIVEHYVLAGVASFFVGIGMGMTSTAFIVAIQTTVSWEIRGIATATHIFMRTIGSAVGVAFLGGLLNSRIQHHINQRGLSDVVTVDEVDKLLDQQAITDISKEVVGVLQTGLRSGLQFVYIGILVIAVLSFITILWMPKQDDNGGIRNET
jgi:EmrB/QacA subfamily drug resistance transporter